MNSKQLTVTEKYVNIIWLEKNTQQVEDQKPNCVFSYHRITYGMHSIESKGAVGVRFHTLLKFSTAKKHHFLGLVTIFVLRGKNNK